MRRISILMLPKIYRLVKEKDFERIFKKGKYFRQDFINLKISKNHLKISRFGLVVGLKISKKAVIRNKIRRQLSEMIRLNLKKLEPGFDIIIIPRLEIINKNYQEIEKLLIKLLKKAKIFYD